MSQHILWVLSVSTIIMTLFSTFGSSMITCLIATWIQSLFVSGILFELGFEYIGLITFFVSSLSIVFVSVYSGTLAGDIRSVFKKLNKKNSIVLGIVSFVISLSLIGLLYLTGSSLEHNPDGSAITAETIGSLLLTNYKIATVMMGLLLMSVLLGSSLVVYLTDRDKQ